eukprot:scaffold1467_cov264-Pinguiococcus_pyrenoidosus.AAC.23
MAVEDSPSLESEPQDSLDGADQWETQPIYHLPPHVIQWTLPRAEAKALAKSLAKFFSTSEEAKVGTFAVAKAAAASLTCVHRSFAERGCPEEIPQAKRQAREE